jgi:hypothetical protein
MMWASGTALFSHFSPYRRGKIPELFFENFMVLERLKYLDYSGQNLKPWFWCTHDRKEIDYLEVSGGRFHVFVFKWGKGVIRTSVMNSFCWNIQTRNLPLSTAIITLRFLDKVREPL